MKNQRRKLLRQRSIQAAEDYEGIVASLKEDLETYLDVLKNNSQARSNILKHVLNP